MRFPEKTMRLYDRLKDDITSGRLTAGSQLPPEQEFAHQLGVGRITLRNALKKLEEDALINRLERKGTFVSYEGKTSLNKVISFLIPYPEYMSQNMDNYSFRVVSQTFYGAVRAAAESGWRLETLPFSRTNNNQDINWDALAHIGENSRLIIFNCWYHTAFETFLERKVKVGMFRDFNQKSQWDPCFRNWINVVMNRTKTYSDAAELFHSRGCRKIVKTNWQSDISGTETLFRKEINHHGMELLELNYDLLNGNPKEAMEKIQDLWKKTHFDALFTDDPGHYFTEQGNIYETLGIPREVMILMRNNDPEYYLKISPQISVFATDMEQIGYTLAQKLIREPYEPCQIVFEQKLCDRETTGGSYISPKKNDFLTTMMI